MTKRLLCIGSALTLLFLAGCKNRSTPNGIVEIAAVALRDNNVEAFRSTLSGKALATYSEQKSLDQLAARLSPYRELSLSPAERTNKQSNPETYRVVVFGETNAKINEAVVSISVSCDLVRGFQRDLASHGHRLKSVMKRNCTISDISEY